MSVCAQASHLQVVVSALFPKTAGNSMTIHNTWWWRYLSWVIGSDWSEFIYFFSTVILTCIQCQWAHIATNWGKVAGDTRREIYTAAGSVCVCVLQSRDIIYMKH